MPSLVGSQTFTLGSLQFSASKNLSAKGAIPKEVTLVRAKTAVLTVRTDNDTGSLTVEAAHGIVDAARLDVYWLDATTGARKSRRGMTVGTVATNVVPIDGGSGDNLPLAAAAVTVMVPTALEVDVAGDNVKAILFQSTRKAMMVIAAGDNTEQLYKSLAANDLYRYYDDGEVTNPLAGLTVGKVFVSHGDAVNSGIVKFAILNDD